MHRASKPISDQTCNAECILSSLMRDNMGNVPLKILADMSRISMGHVLYYQCP